MSPCPSREELQDLLGERLVAEQERALLAHVETCRACQQALEELTLACAPRSWHPAVAASGSAVGEPGQETNLFWRELKAARPRWPSTMSPQIASGLPAGGKAGEPVARPLGRVGRYEVLEEIGRGGMGAVLRGHDPDLGRDLAVKVLLDRHQHDPAVVRRFTEEAQIGGQLQHPGIVPVYEVGRSTDERPFFTMKLVRGRTLALLLRERSDPHQDLPRFEQIFEQVCQTMAYAHSRGVIHRDLKPPNVMVGAFGEVQVMDWGLAKVLEGPLPPAPSGTPETLPVGQEDHPTPLVLPGRGAGEEGRQTRPGHVLGTPAYMAPEQALGATERLDPRCDVFGLGAILCEILTGQPPYSGANDLEVLTRAMRADLREAFARLDACGADGELIRLARSSLAARVKDRPRDAGVLAAEMAAYRESIQTRLRQAELAQAEARARAAEELKRRRLALGLAAWVLLTVLVVGGGWLWVERQQAERQGRARQAGEEALAQVAGLRQQSRWEEALAVLTQARSPLDEAGPAGDPRSESLRRRLAQAVEDVNLAAALEQIRLTPAIAEGGFDYRGMAEAYERALEQAGLEVMGDEATVVSRIRDSEVRRELVMALDHWAFLASGQGNGPLRARLLRLAQEADPDPEWSDRFRKPALWDDPGQLRQLAAELKERLDKGTAGGPATPLLALLAKKLGQQEAEAELLLRAAQRRQPADFWLNYALGEVLRERKPAEAVGFYRAALATRPTLAAVHYEVGMALFRQGLVDEAVKSCRKATELEPKVAWAYHNNLGMALIVRGRKEEAMAAVRNAVELAPEQAGAHCSLAYCLQLNGQVDMAIVEYRRALALDSRWTLAHYHLGMCLQGKGQLDEAMAAFRRAIEVDRTCAPAHFHLGQCWQSKGELDEAMAEYRRASALAPTDWRPHYQLGALLLTRGRQDEALAHFQKAAQWDPGHLGHRALGLGYAARREWGKAADSFARAVEPATGGVAWNDGHFWFEYAAVMLLAGDRRGYGKACAGLVENCGKAPDLRAYHVARACTLAPDCVDAARAGRLAEAELKGRGGEFWSLTEQGALHYRAGRFKEAVPLLKQSLQAEERAGRAVLNWLWLALASKRLGKEEEARRWLDQASRWLDGHAAGMPAGAEHDQGVDLHNWLEAHVLRREADALLQVKPPVRRDPAPGGP
jgi:serine/threonine-protein kinase